MDCPARQLCDYFTSTILLTTEFCGTITCDYKDHELNAVTWNNLYCEGISAIWEGN